MASELPVIAANRGPTMEQVKHKEKKKRRMLGGKQEQFKRWDKALQQLLDFYFEVAESRV